LKGHTGEIWALCISSNGQIVVTGSHDKSIRLWKRSDEQLFIEDEKEKAIEETYEKTLEEQEAFVERNDPNRPEGELGTKKSLATIKSAEVLVEAMEIAIEEKVKMEVYAQELKEAEEAAGVPLGSSAESGSPLVSPPEANIMMLGKSPSDFVFHRLSSMPSPHVDQALLLLPFSQLGVFLNFAEEWIKRGKNVELVSDCVFFLLRVHHSRITSSRDLHNVIIKVRDALSIQLKKRKVCFFFFATKSIIIYLFISGFFGIESCCYAPLAPSHRGRNERVIL
jgi:WD domain, G-beta repeat./Dip2/Utp12 Family.